MMFGIILKKNWKSSLVEILDEKLIPESGMRHAVCRNRTLTPKELLRAEICSSPITYEGITTLEMPKILKSYLRNFKYGNEVTVSAQIREAECIIFPD